MSKINIKQLGISAGTNVSISSLGVISATSSGSNITFLSDVTTTSTLSVSQTNSMVLVKNGSNAITVSLPLISGMDGKVIRIKRLGTGLVTLAVNAGDTGKYIDDGVSTSVQLGVQYASYDIVAREADGMWYLI